LQEHGDLVVGRILLRGSLKSMEENVIRDQAKSLTRAQMLRKSSEDEHIVMF
jgi:hypothetical protein